jgi:phosphomethylpyrimidine synthase
MKITQEVREYAEKHGFSETEAVKKGMEQKSKEFGDSGGKIYIPADE